jgi:chemotaxis protein CheD
MDATAPLRRRLIVGEVFASAEDVEVSTVVGSCIAVCLFDPVARCGGMNHFLLPVVESASKPASASYGDIAMRVLLDAMQRCGAQRAHLQAKVFGAANALRFATADITVGERNLAFVIGYLKEQRIPLLASRVGGRQGINVHFFCRTGQAYVRTVESAGGVGAIPERAHS